MLSINGNEIGWCGDKANVDTLEKCSTMDEKDLFPYTNQIHPTSIEFLLELHSNEAEYQLNSGLDNHMSIYSHLGNILDVVLEITCARQFFNKFLLFRFPNINI